MFHPHSVHFRKQILRSDENIKFDPFGLLDYFAEAVLVIGTTSTVLQRRSINMRAHAYLVSCYI